MDGGKGGGGRGGTVPGKKQKFTLKFKGAKSKLDKLGQNLYDKLTESERIHKKDMAKVSFIYETP
jgi:hypothetical protein